MSDFTYIFNETIHCHEVIEFRNMSRNPESKNPETKKFGKIKSGKLKIRKIENLENKNLEKNKSGNE
jgi:hypothetical protein